MLRCTLPRCGGASSAMEGEVSVDAGTVRSWLAASAVAIREQRDYLTQLDAAIGDADHGANMDRGFAAVVERLDGEASSEPPGKLLLPPDPRSSLPSAVRAARSGAPRSGGPVACSARPRRSVRKSSSRRSTRRSRRRRARRRKRGREDDGRRARARSEGVARAGGDRRRARRGARRGPRGGEEGMRATVPLQARKGRASYLGERSIGHQDPGATSTALILAALERSAAAEA